MLRVRGCYDRALNLGSVADLRKASHLLGIKRREHPTRPPSPVDAFFGAVLLANVDERDMIIRDGPLFALPHPNEVLPIIQVNSGTYLPGCSERGSAAP